jgi:carboxyl-terminal processing protease
MRRWLPTLALLVFLTPTGAYPQSGPQPAPAPPSQPAPPPSAQPAPQSKNSKSGVYDQLNLFGEAFERIRQDAVEPVTDRRLIDTAIAGMLASLDPHSVYLSESEYKALQAPQENSTASPGLVVTLDGGQLKVVSPRDGSPAAIAGIKPGELIFEIDKEPVYDLTLTEIEQKLRGPVDSQVTLTLRGSDGKPNDITLKRVDTKQPTIVAHMDGDDVGYIRISGFDDQTQAALSAAIQKLEQQAGKKLIGFVLDLRNDPGGDFDVAVAAADDFIDKGDIALVKGRKDDAVKHIAATPGDLANGLPIVALVNGGTAHEAELLAGALQDNHRAILVGTKTFGESSIETLIPLNGNGAIKLTTARFETPSGHAIQGKGIDPDLTVVPLKLERLASGLNRHEADLRGALKNTDPVATPGTPPQTPPGPATPAPGASSATPNHETSSAVASGDIGAPDDEQLTQALDVLRGLALVTARNGQ